MIRLAALLLAFPALCAAQAGAPLPKPSVQVDDRWVYLYKNRLKEDPPATYELRVTFAEKDVIHAVRSSPGRSREIDAVWTSEWNAVASMAAGIFHPSRTVLKFPLQPGSTWKTTYESELPRLKSFRARWEWTVKAEGYEDVVLPAGKFRALKVTAEGRWNRLDAYSYGSGREAYWYAAGVGRHVKYEYEEKVLDAKHSVWYEEELLFYSVK